MVEASFRRCGAVEFIATTLTVKYGIVPPTINYQTKDPDCDLDYTPNKAKAERNNICFIKLLWVLVVIMEPYLLKNDQ